VKFKKEGGVPNLKEDVFVSGLHEVLEKRVGFRFFWFRLQGSGIQRLEGCRDLELWWGSKREDVLVEGLRKVPMSLQTAYHRVLWTIHIRLIHETPS
jgi:hypothetical protein